MKLMKLYEALRLPKCYGVTRLAHLPQAALGGDRPPRGLFAFMPFWRSCFDGR